MSEPEFSTVDYFQRKPQHARCNEQSEYDAAVEVATRAIRETWDTMGDMPSPLYEDEARQLGRAALDAIIASQPVTRTTT
ncbi:hypothetical protein A4A58_09545 [Tardiphaga robiniae]|uniref:Uncharacterized protein n=1 Tax=Tardiphaga robiniae TaxID=943830 RepID=A0A163YLE8_9BRAD|nr:hypothetical protein A4A58_09545 [Tardiphaga robiniae]